MKLPTNSIRWRLQIWYATLLLIALAGLSLAVLRLSRTHLIRQLDHQIMEQERVFFETLFKQESEFDKQADGDVAPAPRDPQKLYLKIQELGRNPSSQIMRLFSGTEPGFFYFCLAGRDGTTLLTSDNLPEDFAFPALAERKEFDIRNFRGTFREHLRRGPAGVRVCFGRESAQTLKEMDQLAVSIVLFAAGFWFVGLAGGWWIVGRAIRPLQKISATAVEIARGDLDKRIELAGNQSELDQLGKVLNHTFDELAASMERKRQFTANASHELRTPLTVILAETQRMLKREREVSEYRESMDLCQKAGLRMKSLVEGLLLLARQENRENLEVRETCRLEDIVGQALDALAPLAAERSMKIKTELEPASLKGDASALRILIDNLVGNAISHHPGGGTVWVRLRKLEDFIELEVKDDGPGIAPEFHDRIFERFYHLDKSRTAGHSGLGLALVRCIAENHGGRCTVASVPGEGSRFTVRFSKA